MKCEQEFGGLTGGSRGPEDDADVLPDVVGVDGVGALVGVDVLEELEDVLAPGRVAEAVGLDLAAVLGLGDGLADQLRSLRGAEHQLGIDVLELKWM